MFVAEGYATLFLGRAKKCMNLSSDFHIGLGCIGRASDETQQWSKSLTKRKKYSGRASDQVPAAEEEEKKLRRGWPAVKEKKTQGLWSMTKPVKG